VVDQLAGHPREGECFTCAGLRFEIIDMDRTSVDKVLILPASAATAPTGSRK
jgi:CBS domain containing-hemolysin-like protein